MLQDYNTSSSRILFIRPRFFRHRFPVLARSDFSPLVARSFSLYRVSRSTCCQVQAVDPYTADVFLNSCNAMSKSNSFKNYSSSRGFVAFHRGVWCGSPEISHASQKQEKKRRTDTEMNSLAY
ncbi:hypothetical protein TNCV_821441 [Trichonephila clavipes]|nr:hypothetical protein TNCV_821441 [Trichonephila clavipes]